MVDGPWCCGQHGLVVEVPLHFSCERIGCCVALRGIFLQTLGYDPVQVSFQRGRSERPLIFGTSRSTAAWQKWIFIAQNLVELSCRQRAESLWIEWSGSCQELVEQGTERVDVAAVSILALLPAACSGLM